MEQIRDLMVRTASAVEDAIAHFGADPAAMRRKGERDGQYELDLVADAASSSVLSRAGVNVLSEESGLMDRGNAITVVIDPVDGSTNASRGLPWYACSLCAMDDEGPVAALVANLATGRRWEATRGGGATRDSSPIRPSGVNEVSDSVLVLNGYPVRNLGWKQFRVMGATALDLCSVADGSVDGTADFSDKLGPWDYLGAWLVLREAGAGLEDRFGRDLVVLEPGAKRSPVSAATPELLEELLELTMPPDVGQGGVDPV